MFLLRPAKSEDFDQFLAIKSDALDIHWSGFKTPPSRDQFSNWYQTQLKSKSRKISFLTDGSKICGYMYFDFISGDQVELSYGIKREFQGRGLGKHIIRLAIEYAVTQFHKAKSVGAWIAPSNVASVKAALGAGLQATDQKKIVSFHGENISFELYKAKIHRTLIIAEAGVNHNGDMGLARELVAASHEAGADIVKYQTWITEELVTPEAPKAAYQRANDSASNQFDMLKKLELPLEGFRELKLYCEKIGIEFLSTPDDFVSLNFLADELKLKLLKVGSGEVLNLPYLKRIGSKKVDIILSTGMATLDEVAQARSILLESGAKDVAILHCTSSYPAPFESINLKAMLTLRDAFKCKIGYSDHTLGAEVSVAAVALGAEIIEKHITLDKKLPGPDHVASLDVQEFKSMSQQIRNVESSLFGTGIKAPHWIEIETKKIVSKGVYARADLSAGTCITLDHVQLCRPTSTLTAKDFELIEGKKLVKSVKRGQALNLGDFAIDS